LCFPIFISNEIRMCFCLTRLYKILSSFLPTMEPTRDVSFITDDGERTILQDMIQAVDSVGAWSALRSKSLSQATLTKIRSSMNHAHNDETFNLLLQLLVHMASNWNDWVEKRRMNQESDKEYKEVFETWKAKHKWTENSNNVLLLAYLENIYALTVDRGLTSIQRLQYGVEKIIFELEVALARIDLEDMVPYKNYLDEIGLAKGTEETKKTFQQSLEYKLEICKRLDGIHLPMNYQHCKKRWAENKRYIQACEEMRTAMEKEYKAQHEALELALETKDICDVEKALYKPLVDMSRIRATELYKKVATLYEELRQKERMDKYT